MSPRPSEFETSDIDLAAAIMTASNKQPVVVRHPGAPLVSFQFPNDEASYAVIVAYATGELCQPVKRFAACRANLYRQAKGGRR